MQEPSKVTARTPESNRERVGRPVLVELPAGRLCSTKKLEAPVRSGSGQSARCASWDSAHFELLPRFLKASRAQGFARVHSRILHVSREEGRYIHSARGRLRHHATPKKHLGIVPPRLHDIVNSPPTLTTTVPDEGHPLARARPPHAGRRGPRRTMPSSQAQRGHRAAEQLSNCHCDRHCFWLDAHS